MFTRFGLLGLAAVSGLVLAQEPQVPLAFRGEWASSAEQCGKSHERQLTITAAQVDSYASQGKVLSVRSSGPRDVEIELEERSERITVRHTRHFVLSDDGTRLTHMVRRNVFSADRSSLTVKEEPGVIRIRCK
jgi:hypothetical protein